MKSYRVVIILALFGIVIAILVFFGEPNLRPSFHNDLSHLSIKKIDYNITVFTWEPPDWDDYYHFAVQKAIIYDHRDKQSPLYRLNNGEKISSVPELAGIIKSSILIAKQSDGAFDPTILPLTSLWAFDKGGRLPTPDEIRAGLQKIGYNKIHLDDSEVIQLPPGIQLDLGGIAKGTIIDEIGDYFDDHGFNNYLIEGGGDIIVKNTKPNGALWRIALRAPRIPGVPFESGKFEKGRLKPIGIVEIGKPGQKIALVTSGDYERVFRESGKIYHHLLDPKTGYPARGTASVTVIASTCEQADALATAAFVKGYDEGLKFLESLPNVEGLLIKDIGNGDVETAKTSGFPELIPITTD
ncbi:MAG: FAD:protein FMN transferase [Spirochaetales bacterium]|nr:FAD:protein FMN transferase [Spirochaetales bacterium]